MIAWSSCGLEWMSQRCFARKALFLCKLLLMLSPPNHLGFVTVCQFKRWVFFFWAVSPHRKFLFIWSISLQIFVGSRVHCITWVGRVVVMALMRARHLARESEPTFHLECLEWSLSTMKLKALVFLLSVIMGTPRYFPKLVYALLPSSFSTESMMDGKVWGEK